MIQSNSRRYLCQKQYQRTKINIVHCQANIRRNLVKNHYQQLLVALCKMQSIIKIKVTLAKIRKNIAQRTIVSSMKQYQQKMIRYRRQEKLKAKVMEN